MCTTRGEFKRWDECERLHTLAQFAAGNNSSRLGLKHATFGLSSVSTHAWTSSCQNRRRFNFAGLCYNPESAGSQAPGPDVCTRRRRSDIPCRGGQYVLTVVSRQRNQLIKDEIGLIAVQEMPPGHHMMHSHARVAPGHAPGPRTQHRSAFPSGARGRV